MLRRNSLIIVLFILVLVAGGCSLLDQSPGTEVLNPSQGGDPDLAAEPTETPQAGGYAGNQDSDTESDSSLENAADLDLWLLTATYHWENGRTKTDILYTYQTLLELTGKVVERHSTGFAEGLGGMNIDGECIEAQPVTIEWDYQVSAELIQWDAEVVKQTFGEEAAQNAATGKSKMLELSFSQPEVTLFEMEPFACAPDMDRDFIKVWPRFG